MTSSKMVICPYCGETQPAGERCRACAGLFEPLSRQATHNAMGPWFVRNPERPFQPGCSYETIVRLIERDQVTKYSILRGPTTRQFWTVARRVPGIAHLLGYCHHCDAPVDPEDHGCHACGVSFGAYLDRNFLGLPEVRPLPWEAPVEDDLAREEGRPQAYEMPPHHVGTRISSFASDEELLGGTKPAHPRAVPRPVGGPRAGETGASASPVAVAEPAPAAVTATAPAGDYTSGVALRSMRRKLDAQARTIRLLMVLFVVTLVVTIAVTAVAITRLGPSPDPIAAPPPAAVSPEPEPAEEDPGGGSDVAVETATSGPLGAGPEPAIDGDGEAAAPEDPAPLDPVMPPLDDVDPVTLPPAAAYARAMELRAAASRPERPRAERLADLDEALRILRHLEVSAPETARPADLGTTIEAIVLQRERVRLESFYEGSQPPAA